MKYQIISHITTACNYDCNYCDVDKDWVVMDDATRNLILWFIVKNSDYIERFKFFGWEPLLWFKSISHIIDNSHFILQDNFEIVTNTSLLSNTICEYLEKYFSHIFFSIDSENVFSFEKVIWYIKKYNLEKKLHMNLVISPWKEDIALEQFLTLYKSGIYGFNILPVYFTQEWNSENLKKLWKIMKVILDYSLEDSKIRLYWFQENSWENTSLANNTIFIDVYWDIYYSDIVTTFMWKILKEKLWIWNISDFNLESLENYDFNLQKKYISLLEKKNYDTVKWQAELHKLMDYFSEYLNKKNG